MIALTDVVRHVRAREAADDSEAVMRQAEQAFKAVTIAARAGDHDALWSATITIGDLCLRLCVVPAMSETAAENKRRFLAIIAGWAWTREPALGAVLEAAIRSEREAWGV